MRLRAHRRNLVLWSQSASSIGRYGAPPLTRAGRARWRLLLAGGVLTVVGVTLRGGLGGVILLFLASAPFVLARPKADRMRRADLERELGAYSHPAQRRLAIQAMELHHHRFPGPGLH